MRHQISCSGSNAFLRSFFFCLLNIWSLIPVRRAVIFFPDRKLNCHFEYPGAFWTHKPFIISTCLTYREVPQSSHHALCLSCCSCVYSSALSAWAPQSKLRQQRSKECLFDFGRWVSVRGWGCYLRPNTADRYALYLQSIEIYRAFRSKQNKIKIAKDLKNELMCYSKYLLQIYSMAWFYMRYSLIFSGIP